MSNFIDITGQRFNHLVVIKRVPNDAHGIAKWECRCDCGKTTIVRGKNLKNGAVKSCGCLKHNATNKTHNGAVDKVSHQLSRYAIMRKTA